MNKNDYVEDDEELYRRLPINDHIHRYSHNNEGKVEINSKAFFDRDQQPSVDRAKLKNYDPKTSKLHDTDGIVSLIAGEVRGITIDNHTVDVIYAPILDFPKNLSHSLITVSSKNDLSKSKRKQAFSTLRRSLVLLSTVKIEPQEI